MSGAPSPKPRFLGCSKLFINNCVWIKTSGYESGGGG
ncbi:hypothetical protein C7427_1301, partial [Pantoea ananatis]